MQVPGPAPPGSAEALVLWEVVAAESGLGGWKEALEGHGRGQAAPEGHGRISRASLGAPSSPGHEWAWAGPALALRVCAAERDGCAPGRGLPRAQGAVSPSRRR